MRSIASFSLLLLFPLLSSAQTQQPRSWSPWENLIGTWRGEGEGKPGLGTGTFSFQYDLEKNVIVRKSHSEYPATKDRPLTIHDDLMFVYFDPAGLPNKAIYFDNEGHVINYSASWPDTKSIVLISEVAAGMPRFRLTYRLEDAANLTVSFEIAPPGKPDAFSPYISGKVKKQ